jgi:Fibronectin type III domain/Interleukin-like EMT inducer
MLLLFFFPLAFCRPKPTTLSSADWTAPVLHSHHKSRSTITSILFAWSPASHPNESLNHYEVEVRLKNTDSNFYGPNYVNTNSFQTVYSGYGRAFNLTDLESGVAYEARVRAIGDTSTNSDYSTIKLYYTNVPTLKEFVPFSLTGTGRNNHGFSSIVVNGVTIYDRTDETGLVLAILDRKTLNLDSITTYNTFSSETEADSLATALLNLSYKKFVLIVSTDRFELGVHDRLVRAVEYCGGFHFANFLSPNTQPQPWVMTGDFDIAQTASDNWFAHPYAFLGIPGVGTGLGKESIALNTGHYLSTGHAQHARIAGMFVYIPETGMYSAEHVQMNVDDYYRKGILPKQGTTHNPIPRDRVISSITQNDMSRYVPYIGTLENQIDYLIIANKTYNSDTYSFNNTGFQIARVTHLPVDPSYVAPVTDGYSMSELERIWGGKTKRYDVSVNNDPGTFLDLFTDGILYENRVCAEAVTDRLSSTCLNGECCDDYDTTASTSEMPLLQYAIGLWPTKCQDSCTTQTTASSFSVRTGNSGSFSPAISYRNI